MCDDGSWMAGVAEDVEEDKLKVRAVGIWSDVHGELGTQGGSWLYLWEEEDGTYRGMERPEGTGSLMMTVSVNLVKMAGTLTDTNKLSIITRQRIITRRTWGF